MTIARLFLNAAALLAATACLFAIGRAGTSRRSLPPAEAGTGPHRSFVNTQKEAYGALSSLNLWGAHLVQINRFFNLEDYFPLDEAKTRPFPIETHDIRQDYEAGLTSHNWLFIATRTGMVRRITSVLPESVFLSRAADFRAEYSFRQTDDGFHGYSYDTPRAVTTLGRLRTISEPVAVVIDAGFFVDGSSPLELVSQLRSRCPDIRAVVFVASDDEPETTDEMRASLLSALQLWDSSR